MDSGLPAGCQASGRELINVAAPHPCSTPCSQENRTDSWGPASAPGRLAGRDPRAEAVNCPAVQRSEVRQAQGSTSGPLHLPSTPPGPLHLPPASGSVWSGFTSKAPVQGAPVMTPGCDLPHSVGLRLAPVYCLFVHMSLSPPARRQTASSKQTSPRLALRLAASVAQQIFANCMAE